MDRKVGVGAAQLSGWRRFARGRCQTSELDRARRVPGAIGSFAQKSVDKAFDSAPFRQHENLTTLNRVKGDEGFQ